MVIFHCCFLRLVFPAFLKRGALVFRCLQRWITFRKTLNRLSTETIVPHQHRLQLQQMSVRSFCVYEWHFSLHSVRGSFLHLFYFLVSVTFFSCSGCSASSVLFLFLFQHLHLITCVAGSLRWKKLQTYLNTLLSSWHIT